MRFIIYGAGGVGGVIGAELSKRGRDVVLIARGDHLRAMQSDGLRFQTPHEDSLLQVNAVASPADIDFKPDDVVLMTMKSQHTREALEELREVALDAIPVVCCQNGVDNERMALRRFANVYAMLVYLPAQLLEPGVIQCHAKLCSGILDVGCYPQGIDARCEQIAAELEAVNFSVRPDPKVMRLKYAKLLTNLHNALGAIASAGPETDKILHALRDEGRRCLDAAGIAYASEEEVKARRRGVYESGEIPGKQRVGGSSRQSLLRATGNIEADFLNGEIVSLGREIGIPTPANAVVQRLAVQAARRKAPPGSVSIEALNALIDAEADAKKWRKIDNG